MKILHTADWQIGKHFRNISGDAGAVLRQQRFDTVRRIAELAQERTVAAVLVAGDVFDSNKVSDDTLRRTIESMGAYQGPWVLLAGNHDAARAQSVWTRLRQMDVLSHNIIPATEPRPIELADGRLCVLPAPLQRRHESRDLTAWFDDAASSPGAVRVGLAHGSVTNRLPDRAEAQNPIADTRADSARLDYLALGDWHGTLEIASRSWYAGTPEQDRFKANDPGNVLVVELDSDQPPAVERVRVGRYCWTSLEFRFEGEDAAALLQQQFDALESPADTLVKLQLTGMTDLEGEHQLAQVLAAAKARFHYLQVDQRELRSLPSDHDLATMGATGFLADTVAELAQMAQDDEHPRKEDATRALQMLYFEQRAQAGD